MASEKRRLAIGGVGALAICLAMASAAWACTVFYGDLTISGNDTGNVPMTIAGDPGSFVNWPPPDPAGKFMTWCDYDSGNNEDAGFWTAAVDRNSPQLSVSVAPSASCTYGGTNQLPAASNYVVGVHSFFLDETDNSGADHNCHGSHQTTTVEGNFVVSAAGTGSGNYNLTTPIHPGWNSVCVYLESSSPFAPANASNFLAV